MSLNLFVNEHEIKKCTFIILELRFCDSSAESRCLQEGDGRPSPQRWRSAGQLLQSLKRAAASCCPCRRWCSRPLRSLCSRPRSHHCQSSPQQSAAVRPPQEWSASCRGAVRSRRWVGVAGVSPVVWAGPLRIRQMKAVTAWHRVVTWPIQTDWLEKAGGCWWHLL